MPPASLRERKKLRTRAHIAAAAAELFASSGYEQVSVRDVAAAAEVSEQTVYNYFPAKRDLVLDRDDALRERLIELIRDRPPGRTPAAAIRSEALSLAGAMRGLDDAQVRGGLGYLATRSPELRRLALEMTDRHADAIAEVLAAEPGGPPPAIAKHRATALAWVFQTITDASGHGTEAGLSPSRIADELEPLVEQILSELGG